MVEYQYVCEEWFPKESGRSYRPDRDGFPMHPLLVQQIESIAKNAVKDWDFVCLVCGKGEMRVGKSVIAMQIACLWSYLIWKLHGIKVPFTVKDNYVFNGRDLIPKGMKLGQNYKYASIVDDEAADDLESVKVLKAATQAVKDYLRKAAQYNMLTMLVQSEFFEIPKAIALSRSLFMINVDYTCDEKGYFQRGYFEFYSKYKKKKLYLYGKKELDYNAVKGDFEGNFVNFYPLDEKEYREEKFKGLQEFVKVSKKEAKQREALSACFQLLYEQLGSCYDVSEKVNSKLKNGKISRMYVERVIAKDYPRDDEEMGDV